MRPKSAAAAIIMVLMPCLALAVGRTSCHIHPPGSTPRKPVNTIGPFDSVRRCEQIRLERFGAAGRCHCSADFTPDWRQLAPDTTPDQRPLL